MTGDAFVAVVEALARRDLTSSELDKRLARAGFDRDTRAAALARAVEAGYLDDGRVALERARRLADRGLSDEGIRAELRRRGVPEGLAESALAALVPERERADRLARKLGGGLRAARALSRRGYPVEVVERTIGLHIAE